MNNDRKGDRQPDYTLLMHSTIYMYLVDAVMVNQSINYEF